MKIYKVYDQLTAAEYHFDSLKAAKTFVKQAIDARYGGTEEGYKEEVMYIENLDIMSLKDVQKYDYDEFL